MVNEKKIRNIYIALLKTCTSCVRIISSFCEIFQELFLLKRRQYVNDDRLDLTEVFSNLHILKKYLVVTTLKHLRNNVKESHLVNAISDEMHLGFGPKKFINMKPAIWSSKMPAQTKYISLNI